METLSSSADSSSLNPTGPPLPGVTRLRRHESRLEVNFGENSQSDRP